MCKNECMQIRRQIPKPKTKHTQYIMKARQRKAARRLRCVVSVTSMLYPESIVI